MQVIIYDLNGADGDAVRDTLIGLGLGLDFGYGDGQDQPLALGEKYGDDEMSLGTDQEIADALIESFPSVTFEVWQDPKYEWDGTITIYAPDLGRYGGTCNSEGEPYLTARQVRDGIAAGDIDKTLGLVWLDRIDELKEKLEKAVPVG